MDLASGGPLPCPVQDRVGAAAGSRSSGHSQPDPSGPVRRYGGGITLYRKFAAPPGQGRCGCGQHSSGDPLPSPAWDRVGAASRSPGHSLP